MSYINFFSKEAHVFDMKNVHLTRGAGHIFAKAILRKSEAFIYLEDESAGDNNGDNGDDDDDIQEMVQGLEETQTQLQWAATPSDISGN